VTDYLDVKAHTERESKASGKASGIPDCGSKWRWVISCTPRHFYLWERERVRWELLGVFLGRIAGLEMVAKRLSEMDFMSLSLRPATLLSGLCRFLLLTSFFYWLHTHMSNVSSSNITNISVFQSTCLIFFFRIEEVMSTIVISLSWWSDSGPVLVLLILLYIFCRVTKFLRYCAVHIFIFFFSSSQSAVVLEHSLPSLLGRAVSIDKGLVSLYGA